MNMMTPAGILVLVMILAVGVLLGLLLGVRVLARREDGRSYPSVPPRLDARRQVENPWAELRERMAADGHPSEATRPGTPPPAPTAP